MSIRGKLISVFYSVPSPSYREPDERIPAGIVSNANKKWGPTWLAGLYELLSSLIGTVLTWFVLLALFFTVFTAIIVGLYYLVNFILDLTT